MVLKKKLSYIGCHSWRKILFRLEAKGINVLPFSKKKCLCTGTDWVRINLIAFTFKLNATPKSVVKCGLGEARVKRKAERKLETF